MAKKMFVSVGDTELYIVVKGTGFPIFLLHGGPGLEHQFLGNYFDDLTDRFQLIFVDQRGQGKSKDVPFETITTKQSAQDINSLAKELKIDSYAILGHSYGAFVALEHAVRYPGVAENIILLNGLDTYKRQHETPRVSIEIPKGFREAQEEYYRLINIAENEREASKALDVLLPYYFGDPTDVELINDFREQTKEGVFKHKLLYSCFDNNYGGFDLRDKLDRVENRVLIISGDSDLFCRSFISEEMYKKIKEAELVIYYKTGHMTFVEKNTEVLNEIRNFIRK